MEYAPESPCVGCQIQLPDGTCPLGTCAAADAYEIELEIFNEKREQELQDG